MLQHTKTEHITALEAAALSLLLPGMPRTGWLPVGVARDTRGFVLTGTEAANDGTKGRSPAPYPFGTTLPGLFAAGELRRGALGDAAALTDGVDTGRQVATYLRVGPSSQELWR